MLHYRVSGDGNVFFIDAYPDNLLTSGLFGKNFVRSRPDQAAGVKNWRSLILDDEENAWRRF